MAFSIRAAAGQPNFRPNSRSQGRNTRVRTTSEGATGTATAPSGKGIPLWAGAMLIYAAGTPVYCHFNTQKQLREGWAKAAAREAEAKAAATTAAAKTKGKKEVEAVVVEAPKEVPVVVAAAAPVTSTTTEGVKKEQRKWVVKLKERKWVKPTVTTAVSVGVGAAVIGAAAYYDKRNKGTKKA